MGRGARYILTTATTRITRINSGRNKRHYQVEESSELFPSVTTVLGIINKPGLVPWAKNIALLAKCVIRPQTSAPKLT